MTFSSLTLLTSSVATTRLILLLLTTTIWASSCDGIQFFLETHTKRCFREDIPIGMKSVFSYTIAQGSGAMPVTVTITDGLEKVISNRQEADHGVMTFSTPQSISDSIYDTLKEGDHTANDRGNRRNSWALRNEDNVATNAKNDAERLLREFPDTLGDNRLPYFFCFEHRPHRSLHLPHLSMQRDSPKRRIIFNVGFGAHARSQQFYDELAKEKHLSSTEELFKVVDDRVNEVVRLIDEMRQREVQMKYITETTSRTVTLYSVLACVSILVGALYTSFWTVNFLSKTSKKQRMR